MARRLGPQDPELETLLESVGAPESEPSVHSKLNTVDGKVNIIDTTVDAILEDTGTTIPGTLSTIGGKVDAILEDTGTTLPGTLSSISGKVDTVDDKVDQALLDVAAVKSVADSILEDTGTTLPATLSTIDGKIDIIDTVVDTIAADVGDFGNTTLAAEIASIKTIVDGISTSSGNFTVLLAEQLERPDAGYVDYIYTVMHRVNGVMTDLDSPPTADLDYTDGTEASSLLYNDDNPPTQSTSATKKSTGHYQGRVRVPYNQAAGTLTFVVTGVYDSKILKQARGTRIDESFTLAWNSTDATRLENVNAAINGTGGLVDDVATIDSKIDVIDGNVDSIKTTVESIDSNISLIKGVGFNSTTDSLAAIRDKIDDMASSSGLVFRAVKSSGSINVGGSEIVSLTPAEGFVSKKAKIYNVKVSPVSASTNFKVEIFEKSDASTATLLAAWDKLSQSKPLNDNLCGFVFWNQDTTQTEAMYVKVTNVSGVASTFNVEIRGDVVA